MLSVRNLHFAFGGRTILDGVTLSILRGEKVALVGQNGMGKSTLLALIAEELQPDAGVVEIASNMQLGVLAQIPKLNEELSVLETVRNGMSQLIDGITEHGQLYESLSEADAVTAARIHKRIASLEDIIEQKGGFDVDFRVERALTRLGIVARDQKISTLSGGEKRRVDLARLLLSAPDAYLLDEPTNHLDIGAIQFLVETFSNSQAPLLFISHDRAFIDELATRIIELDKGKLYAHEPPYINYIENRLIRETIDGRSAHRRERLMVRELAWLRAGTPARTTKQTARIDRAGDLIDQVNKDAEVLRKKQVQVQSSTTKRLGKTILELLDVGVAFGNRILFKNLNLKVASGERFGILGPNGCGKTTLLSILAKKTDPSFGQVKFGINTECLQFDQHRTQLDPNSSLKETLADYGDYVFVGDQRMHIASYLEKYLFSPDDMNRKVSTLSGGEQNRLLLAKLFRHNANCLLLDEPTNDLDVATLGTLEEHLVDFVGVAFIVSHDRSFLDRVCTGIIAFEKVETPGEAESKVTVYQGDYTTYLRLKANQLQQALPAPETAKEAKDKDRIKNPATKRKRSFKEEREYAEIERKIELLEAERDAIHTELQIGNASQSARLPILDSEIETLYARWQELENYG